MDLSLTILIGALAAANAIGIAARGRLPLGRSLALYLLSIAVFNTLIGLWPDRFQTWPVYLVFEATHAALKVALAFELSWLVFQAFPSAGRAARLGLLAIVAATTAWVAVRVPTSLGEWIREGLPRIKCGEAFLLCWLLAVVLWYRIPLHFLHKAVLMTLAPYLLVFTVGLQALETFGWTGFVYWRYLNVFAFMGVLVSWLGASWRRTGHEMPSGVAKIVQPWA